MITKTILHFFLRNVLNIECLKVVVSFMSSPLLDLNELERLTGLRRVRLIEIIERLVLRGVLKKSNEKLEFCGVGGNFLRINSCKGCIGCVQGETIDEILDRCIQKRNVRRMVIFDEDRQIQLCIELFGKEEAIKKYGKTKVEEILSKI